MKRLFAFVLCLVLLMTLALPAFAAEQGTGRYSDAYAIENGLTVEDEVIVYSQRRATDKTAVRRITIKDGETVVGIIAIQATFRYDGTTASVVSKSVIQSDTYDGWEYVQKSFTSSGGTVTLNAKLTKWIILNTSFTMTLSCDKDGNISYT